MVYNAADRKNVRAAEKQAKRETKARAHLISTIMGSQSGRQWFHDLLTRCHIFESSFALEVVAMAFKEGERNIGLQIVTDLMESCPNLYVQMMREANERRAVDEQRYSQDSERGDQGPVSTPDGDGSEGGDGGPEVDEDLLPGAIGNPIN